MKPSREEVEKLAQECFHAYSEWHIDLERFAAAMYAKGAEAERAASDKLEKALKTVLSNVILGHRWHDMVVDALAEIEAMRKEKPE